MGSRTCCSQTWTSQKWNCDDLSITDTSSSQADNLVADITSAIEVHPYSLGIAGNVKGYLPLPMGLSMQITHITNPLKHAAGIPNQKNSHVLGDGSEYSMPEFMYKLVHKLATANSVRAVVVTEHRSIRALFQDEARGQVYVNSLHLPTSSSRTTLLNLDGIQEAVGSSTSPDLSRTS
ncbi:hypothetical protein PV11_06482 [Exophiala sideris]|uniref:Uncharacterized protein n=1 Tax=Exophiala sideris TaxID=1016849 RepID=A0A0D1Y7M7_9EURO|nr:hypothetical protein PV11_06482 [Exophiala sideris]